MQEREMDKNFLAGLFFVFGITLIFFVIFTLGNRRGMTQPKFKVTVLFSDVGGLVEGAPVRLSGVNVGNVNKIYFLQREVEGKRVGVVLNIFNKYKEQIESHAVRFLISTEGVLGGKLIEISVLESGPKLNINKPIYGEDPLNVQDVAEVFRGAVEAFSKTSENLSKIDVQELSGNVSSASEAFVATSEDVQEAVSDLRHLIRKTHRVLDRFEEKLIEGNLFKVF